MPVKNQTLGEMLKLTDLPLEEREQISDAIKYSAEHDSEFYTQVNHEKLDENKTTMTFTRSYLPEIDKTSERYINGLIEGITPEAEQLNEAEFSVSVKENGWYYVFTKKLVNHAWSDIKKRCVKHLKNTFNSYHDEKIADTYLKSANIVTGCDLTNLKDLQRLNTILFKNGAQPFADGYYRLVVAPEMSDAIGFALKDFVKETKEKEWLLKNEMGNMAGLKIIKSRLQAFAWDASKRTCPFICYGLTKDDEYGVSICAYDNMADSIVPTPWGGLGNDPLKQRGAIGLYVDGHGFYVKDDSVIIAGTSAQVAEANISQVNGMDFTGDNNADKRSNLVRSGSAREITPNYDYVKMYKLNGSSTANSFQIIAYKPDGTQWQYGSSAGKIVTTSGNTAVATVSGNTVTAVKAGIATIVLTSHDNPNVRTFVTVEVVDGKGDGIVAD